jgi:hypothetical protein
MSNRNLLTLSALVFGVAASASLSCTKTECGDGTIERDGVCVPGDFDPDSAHCGEGTVLGPSGQCESEYLPTVCQEGTTMPDETLEPGVVTCVGIGGGGCDIDLPCPSPTPNSGKISFCGRIYDVGDDHQIQALTPTTKACSDPEAAQDGPCALTLQFFDALDFAANPTTTTPLQPGEFTIDDCGRWAAKDLPRPGLGFLGIGLDDETNPGIYRLTGVAFPAVANQTKTKVRAYVVLDADVQAWSTDAGQTDFATQGVFATTFYRGTASSGYVPVAGVQITEAGNVEAANDWYFDDTILTSRKSVSDTLTATGPNGSGLKINSGLVEHSGTGAEPSGCTWTSALARAIPGVVFYSPRFAVMGMTECP